jgi:hypothetical protein
VARGGQKKVALDSSFRINMRTGRWADFATQDKGGDVISLYAFLNSLRQSDAAYRLHNEVKGGR